MKSPKPATDNRLKNKLKATFEIEQCWIFAVLWQPFWKWRPVEIFWCQESIQDIEIEQCWICAVLWWPFWKWRPVEIFRCQESFRDIIIYPHMKCCWNWTMLNLYGIVVAILKMVTGRNFQCWIFAVLWWPFWKWRPVEIFWCQESIQDVEIEQCWICAVLWWPFWKWGPVEIFRCQES